MMGKSTLGILVSIILLSGILGVISFEDADAKKPKEIVVVGSKAKDLEKELLLDQCIFTLLSPTGESTIIQDVKKKNKVSLKIPDDAEITAVQCLFVDGSIGEEFTVELGEDGKTKVTVIHPRTIAIDSFFDVFVETNTTPNSFFDVFFEVDSFFDVFFDIETPRDVTCLDGEELKLNDDSSIWECAPADTVDSFFDVFFDLLAWHEIQDKKITELEERIAALEVGLSPPSPPLPSTTECDVFDTHALTTNFISATITPPDVTYTLTNNFDCELTFAQGFKSVVISSRASNSFELAELTLGPFEEIEVVSTVPIPDPKQGVRWTIFNQVSLTDITPVGKCDAFGNPSACPSSGSYFFR